MTTQTRSNVLHGYQLVLYSRALHPELFQLRERRRLVHDGYELEAWLMPGMHLLRFTQNNSCACELVTWQEDNLPTEGAVTTFPCAGEKDFEHAFTPAGIEYINAVQTEQLSENLYATTFAEMLDHAKETGSISHQWNDDAGRCLSVLELHRYSREVHAESFHLHAAGGIVLRTQTIFKVA